MHEYKLTFSSEEDTVTVSGEFKDEDWERFKDYAQYADDLMHTKFVQDGMDSSLKIKWDYESGMKVYTELPNWDDFQVFLHKFRSIGLKSESTYFYKICNILTKEIANPYFRKLVQLQREVYSGKAFQKQFQITSDEVVLNSEKVLSDWLNAYEYHRNKEKQEFLDSLHTIFPLEASKVLFIALLTDKTKAIYAIAALVRVILGLQKQVEGKISSPD